MRGGNLSVLKKPVGFFSEKNLDLLKAISSSQKKNFLNNEKSIILKNKELSKVFSELSIDKKIKCLGLFPVRYQGETIACIILGSSDHETLSREIILNTTSLSMVISSHIFGQLEAEKRQMAEEKWASLTENTADTVLVINKEGIIQFINRDNDVVEGDIEVIGTSAYDYIPENNKQKVKEALNRVINKGVTEVYQTNVTNVNDSVAGWYETLARPLFYQGKIIGATLVASNISEQMLAEEATKESENNLLSVIEAAPAIVLSVDAKYHILTINTVAKVSFKQILGVDINPGQCMLDMIPPEMKPVWQERYDRALAGEQFVVHDSFSAGGIDFYSDVFFNPIRKGDTVTGVSVFSQDTTERIKTEESLRRAQKMDALGQLTGGIAHDFNNLLGIILGYLDLLELRNIFNEDSKKIIKNIRNGSERAAKLTNQLLGFARSMSEHSSNCNIRSLINEMSDLITRSITPNIVVEYDLPDDLWVTNIDPGDFKDALLNLVLNAKDAMNSKGKLSILTSNVELGEDYCSQYPELSPGEYIQLKVIDNGVGITDIQKDRIFEPFYSTKEKGQGSGLGLAMVFGFITRSKGHIDVESSPGELTAFSLYFPRVKGPEAPKEKIKTKKEILPGGSETILVVDDELSLLSLAETILSTLGYRVLPASNGHSALSILKDEKDISLLLSDIIMPGGINGFELADGALAINPNLKILLTSGYVENEPGNKIQEKYRKNILKKPYTIAEIAEKVHKLLNE